MSYPLWPSQSAGHGLRAGRPPLCRRAWAGHLRRGEPRHGRRQLRLAADCRFQGRPVLRLRELVRVLAGALRGPGLWPRNSGHCPHHEGVGRRAAGLRAAASDVFRGAGHARSARARQRDGCAERPRRLRIADDPGLESFAARREQGQRHGLWCKRRRVSRSSGRPRQGRPITVTVPLFGSCNCRLRSEHSPGMGTAAGSGLASTCRSP